MPEKCQDDRSSDSCPNDLYSMSRLVCFAKSLVLRPVCIFKFSSPFITPNQMHRIPACVCVCVLHRSRFVPELHTPLTALCVGKIHSLSPLSLSLLCTSIARLSLSLSVGPSNIFLCFNLPDADAASKTRSLEEEVVKRCRVKEGGDLDQWGLFSRSFSHPSGPLFLDVFNTFLNTARRITLQMHTYTHTHRQTRRWAAASCATSAVWYVCVLHRCGKFASTSQVREEWVVVVVERTEKPLCQMVQAG